MTRITGAVPLDGDVFTQAALDGLVGQTAPLTAKAGDVTRPIGRAEVVEARQEDGFLLLTVETTPPEREREHIETLLGHVGDYSVVEGRVTDAEAPMSIGYTIADARAIVAHHREFNDVRLVNIGPASMPFDRQQVLDNVRRLAERSDG